jgi:serine phosphatase RsbU (regulator of sigma subunit)
MERIGNLSIGKRLGLIAFSAFLTIILTQTAGIVNTARLADGVHLGYQSITRPMSATASARGKFNAMWTALHEMSHDFNTIAQKRGFKEDILRTLEGYERNINLYWEILGIYGTNDPYELEAVAYLHDQLAPLRRHVEYIISVASRVGYEADAVRILRGDFLEMGRAISSELEILTRILEAQAYKSNLNARSLYMSNIVVFAIVTAMGLTLLSFCIYMFAYSTVRQVRGLRGGLGKIAGGDLDARIEGSYNVEFNEIREAVNSMAADIKMHISGKLDAERAAHEFELAKGRADAARDAVISSLEYASRIQRSLLPPDSELEAAFADYACIWKPKDIVGGDIYWIKRFGGDAVLCVCDCTGHGTPGALLTVIVASAFEATVSADNCKDPAQIVWELEKRLVAVLNVETPPAGVRSRGLTINDGCDLAVLCVASDGAVTFSAGNTHVYLCDGAKATRFRGQRIRVGEGTLRNKEDVKVTALPANPNNKFYIASDGLYEQIGGADEMPFGYDTLERIILENHAERQSVISEKVWSAFEEYRGENPRRDDFELITFRPKVRGV